MYVIIAGIEKWLVPSLFVFFECMIFDCCSS
jgi:hypothetical protein